MVILLGNENNNGVWTNPYPTTSYINNNLLVAGLIMPPYK